MKFEWDDKKAQSNISKHKISFEEASTVFYDDEAILFDDPDHSEDEERFNMLGFSPSANLLIVCHCIREKDIIRIISARKATKNEAKQYKEINESWW